MCTMLLVVRLSCSDRALERKEKMHASKRREQEEEDKKKKKKKTLYSLGNICPSTTLKKPREREEKRMKKNCER